MIVRCEGNVEWTAFLDPETERWIGTCPPLGLAAEGETWQELTTDAYAAMELLLRHLMTTGELESFLRDNGWHCERPIPQGVPPQEVTFDIPAWIIPTAAPPEQRVGSRC